MEERERNKGKNKKHRERKESRSLETRQHARKNKVSLKSEDRHFHMLSSVKLSGDKRGCE